MRIFYLLFLVLPLIAGGCEHDREESGATILRDSKTTRIVGGVEYNGYLKVVIFEYDGHTYIAGQNGGLLEVNK